MRKKGWQMKMTEYDVNRLFNISAYHSKLLGIEAQIVWGELLHRIQSGHSENIRGMACVPYKAQQLGAAGSAISFLGELPIRKGLRKLMDWGLTLPVKNKKKNTGLCAVAIFNFIMMEDFGQDYQKFLIPIDNSDFSGRVLDCSLIDWSSYTRVEPIPAMYPADFDVASERVLDQLAFSERIKSIYGDESTLTPMDMSKLCIPAVVRDDDVSPITAQDEKAVSRVESVREQASSDYKEYCRYLKSGELLSKNTENWNSKDFVVYIYCGMAKWSSPPFKIPNFPRDCAQIKRVFEMYGKGKLRDLITFLVVNYSDLKKIWQFRDYEISIQTFCTDWKVDKLRVEMERRHYESLEHKRAVDFKEHEKMANKWYMENHTTKIDGLVEHLRNQLSNKESKDGKEEQSGGDAARSADGGNGTGKELRQGVDNAPGRGAGVGGASTAGVHGVPVA